MIAERFEFAVVVGEGQNNRRVVSKQKNTESFKTYAMARYLEMSIRASSQSGVRPKSLRSRLV